MAMSEAKIQNFTDLVTWQIAHALVLEVYKLTKRFPPEERFGLVSQMRRCGVSITSNVAEGFSRRTGKEKRRFYDIAIGSLFELQNQLLLSKDLGYLDQPRFDEIQLVTLRVNRLLNGLIKSVI